MSKADLHKTTTAHATYSEKALSLIIEGQQTKFQYNVLRKSALEMNCNLYPNYESIIEAKKSAIQLALLVRKLVQRFLFKIY